MIDLVNDITQMNLYAKTSQSLRDWSGRDTLDSYTMAIHTGTQVSSEHARRYSAPQCFKTLGSIVKMRDRVVVTGYIMLYRKGASNQTRIQISDKAPVVYRF